MLQAQDLNLREEFIAEGKHNRPGTIIRPTHVTIHNTDNDSPGADAPAHSGFVRKTGFYMLNGSKHWVSWHFTVDDKVAIKHLPLNELAYHAGPGNGVSVAIEICMNQGIDQAAANERAALLTAGLLNSLNVAIDNVVPHKKWTGKICPHLLLDHEALGAKWTAFIDLVRQFQASLGQQEGAPFASSQDMESMRSMRATPVEEIAPEALAADIDHAAMREQFNQ